MPAKKYVVDIDANNNQLLNVSLQNLATHPFTTVAQATSQGRNPGWVYWNTAAKTAYIYTGVGGSEWLDLGSFYTHPTVGGVNPTLTGSKVLATLVTNAEGHITSVTTRDLTLSDLGYTPYSHPTFTGNDLGTALTGAMVISDIDVNSNGHVTGFATRSLTPANIGAASSSHTHTLSNITDVTATAAEVNLLDLSGLTAGWVLRATSASTAVWAKLNGSDITNDLAWVSINDSVNNSTTQTWSSSKIKAEIDVINSAITGGLINKGGYDAAANSPLLDATPIAGIKNGWTYVITVAGTFFTENVQVGDMIIAKQDSPTTLAHWTVVNKNIADIVDAAIGIKGIVELATDAETQTGTNTTKAITPSNLSSRTATETRTGIAEIATQAETDAGVDDTRIVTPLKLKASLDSRVGGYAANFGDGVATSFNITHSLNTLDVNVQIFENATGETVEAYVKRNSTTIINIQTNTPPTAAQYRVVIKK